MSRAWSGKALKKKARSDLKKNYLRCILVAAILLLVVNIGSILKEAGKDKERGILWVKTAQEQRDRNFIFDVYVIHAKYHYCSIIMHEDFSYTPSEAGKALSDALEKMFPFKADVITAGDEGSTFQIWGTRTRMNLFHFPSIVSQGPGHVLVTGSDLLWQLLKLVVLIVYGFIIVIAARLAGWGFFLSVSKGEGPGVGYAFSEFLQTIERRMHSIGIIIIMELKIFCWSLLLIIPGIVKAMEYAMVPYVVANDGKVSSDEAFYKSRKMMQGQKKKTFFLWLSFAGYYIIYLVVAALELVFSGVVPTVIWLVFSALWLFPYQQLTFANLYLELASEKEE